MIAAGRRSGHFLQRSNLRLLLDTHVLLWAAFDDAKLRPPFRKALTSPGNDVFVSAASAWELAIKSKAGALLFPLGRWNEIVDAMRWKTLAIHAHHAIEAGSLALHHRDPFDRMLIAQARLEGLMLVTVDRVAYAMCLGFSAEPLSRGASGQKC